MPGGCGRYMSIDHLLSSLMEYQSSRLGKHWLSQKRVVQSYSKSGLTPGCGRLVMTSYIPCANYLKPPTSQIEREVVVELGGALATHLKLAPYERPEIPEQFLAVRT